MGKPDSRQQLQTKEKLKTISILIISLNFSLRFPGQFQPNLSRIPRLYGPETESWKLRKLREPWPAVIPRLSTSISLAACWAYYIISRGNELSQQDITEMNILQNLLKILSLVSQVIAIFFGQRPFWKRMRRLKNWINVGIERKFLFRKIKHLFLL